MSFPLPASPSSAPETRPIEHLVSIHKLTDITVEQLNVATLTTFPETITLRLKDEAIPHAEIKRRGVDLSIELILDSRSLAGAKKFGAKPLAMALNKATGYHPNNTHPMAGAPMIVAASYHLPYTVRWNLKFPADTRGCAIVNALALSNRFLISTATDLLR